EANIAKGSKVMTDDASWYKNLNADGRFASHGTVNHSQEEWARYTKLLGFPDGKPYVIHTNTVEGYYSIFKRGMKGVYQHCKEKQKRTPKTSDKREYERFVETARKLGCDENEETFEQTFKKIVSPKMPSKD